MTYFPMDRINDFSLISSYLLPPISLLFLLLLFLISLGFQKLSSFLFQRCHLLVSCERRSVFWTFLFFHPTYLVEINGDRASKPLGSEKMLLGCHDFFLLFYFFIFPGLCHERGEVVMSFLFLSRYSTYSRTLLI